MVFFLLLAQIPDEAIVAHAHYLSSPLHYIQTSSYHEYSQVPIDVIDSRL